MLKGSTETPPSLSPCLVARLHSTVWVGWGYATHDQSPETSQNLHGSGNNTRNKKLCEARSLGNLCPPSSGWVKEFIIIFFFLAIINAIFMVMEC